jgi:hypothetical protein
MESGLKTRVRILLDRLERISADSIWAHQASGVRASLARAVADPNTDVTAVKKLLVLGFEILEKAAAEIPDQ